MTNDQWTKARDEEAHEFANELGPSSPLWGARRNGFMHGAEWTCEAFLKRLGPVVKALRVYSHLTSEQHAAGIGGAIVKEALKVLEELGVE